MLCVLRELVPLSKALESFDDSRHAGRAHRGSGAPQGRGQGGNLGGQAVALPLPAVVPGARPRLRALTADVVPAVTGAPARVEILQRQPGVTVRASLLARGDPLSQPRLRLRDTRPVVQQNPA